VMTHVHQYDIVLVNLDPTIGSEMKKTRPCVVLSPNEMNKYLKTIVIAPMTSSSRPYPTRVEVKRKTGSSWIVIDQIRTIDRVSIVNQFESLTEKEIAQVKYVIQETFVL
jgi:mRNA interferase MazF